jgi:hypothetical protein
MKTPLKVISKQDISSPNNDRSPYLKAILSGSSRIHSDINKNTIPDSDREAALRYIRESRMLKRK